MTPKRLPQVERFEAPKPGEILRIGRKLYGTCADCLTVVRINGISQGRHQCEPAGKEGQ